MRVAQSTLAAHYGEYMIHPVAVTLGLFLISNSIVEVSIQPKTKRDNAFQYVVLHPSAQSSSDDITAATGRCRCKITNFICISALQKEKSEKIIWERKEKKGKERKERKNDSK